MFKYKLQSTLPSWTRPEGRARSWTSHLFAEAMRPAAVGGTGSQHSSGSNSRPTVVTRLDECDSGVNGTDHGRGAGEAQACLRKNLRGRNGHATASHSFLIFLVLLFCGPPLLLRLLPCSIPLPLFTPVPFRAPPKGPSRGRLNFCMDFHTHPSIPKESATQLPGQCPE